MGISVSTAPKSPCSAIRSSVKRPALCAAITLVNLQTGIGDAIRLSNALPCNNKYYDYSNTPPPDHLVYLPILTK